MPKEKQKLQLKTPNIDFKKIHPMMIAMGERKPTKAKVSLYFHEVLFWLKSALLSLESYRELQNKRRDTKFVKNLNSNDFERYEYIDKIDFFLENAVIRLSAVRDKLALTSYIYYLHPVHLGKKDFTIKECNKCGNKNYHEKITEKNCNFGLLLRYLEQEKVDDNLAKALRKINLDTNLTWVINQRNIISHRMSKYRWIGLGIFPESMEVKYEGNKEIATWALGSPRHTFFDGATKIEETYNNFVSYVEELIPIFFP